MSADNFMKLKSGTDIRGTAVQTPAKTVELTDEAVEKIISAFIYLLSEKSGKAASELTIAIGRDCRISGERIRDTAVAAMTEVGVTVLDCQLASTPAMFMTTVMLGCDAAVQITASHHPYDRNGLKFFLPEGGLNGEQIKSILEAAQDGRHAEKARGSVKNTDFMSTYAAELRRLICSGTRREKPLEGFHIVVDAGNGVGGFYATQVLAPLGADISGSRFLEPDGMFPNHIPNPENESAMESICQAVITSGADLGVIFDTDVDRAGCVDGKGREINKNRLVALASALVLEEHPGGTIVTDSVTSDGLSEFIISLGGKHHRFRRGYRNVIDEAIRLNRSGINAPLAIETSGHAALRDNYFLDDGAYLITRIILKLAQLKENGASLEALIDSLKEPAESLELRFPINEEYFKAYGESVLEKLKIELEKMREFTIAPDNYEGIRACYNCNGSGWLLLRLSVHDPVMPLNVESDEKGGVLKILRLISSFMHSRSCLDCSALDKYFAENG